MALRVRVCRVADVPEGSVRAVQVPGVTWPVLVTRLGGELIATAGVCPHEDVSLEGGELDGGTIVCPGHAWEFDRRGNAFKRNEFGRVDPKGKVPTLRLREDGDGISVEAG